MAKDPKDRRKFFKDFKAELKKVIWPTPKQIVNGTIAVITIVLIIAGIVFVLDLSFDFFNTTGLNGIRERIVNRDGVETIEESINDFPLILDAEDNEYYEESYYDEEMEENNDYPSNDYANEEIAE